MQSQKQKKTKKKTKNHRGKTFQTNTQINDQVFRLHNKSHLKERLT